MNIKKRNSLLYVPVIIILSLALTSLSFDFAKKEIRSKAGMPIIAGDSAQLRLQKVVDSLYGEIAVYNDLVFRQNQLTNRQKELFSQYKLVSDSLRAAENFSIESICVELKSKKSEKEIKDQLGDRYAEIFRLEDKLVAMEADSTSRAAEANDIENKIRGKKDAHQKALSFLRMAAEKVSGAGVIKINNISCGYFIVQKKEYAISIHNNRNKNRGQSFEEIKAVLKNDRKDAVMITNGGMFAPDFGPQGLLIEKSKEVKPLDTSVPDNSASFNFYMQPNGVFSIEPSGLFRVSTTGEFKTKYASKEIAPEFATQSGPMLVFHDTINSNFTSGSKNVKLRSGVGEISQEKIVFIISYPGINFFDFALLFREIFACKNALYLDGAISQMYLNEKIAGITSQTPTDGAFGPVISIGKSNK